MCIFKVTEDKELDPDPLIRGTDPEIRIQIQIRVKMSRIPNTGGKPGQHLILHIIIWMV
jgi:hypothetical protein